jgi:transcriptional regulator with XRE-family HTH domain
MITMVKLSDLRTAGQIHEQDMKDLDYRREYERTKLANDVAIKVLRYRTDRRLSQAELGRMIGMPQPHVARLESGEHEPSLSTLARLSAALGLDFSVDIKPSGLKLRYVARQRKRALRGLAPSRRVVLLLPALQRLGGWPGVWPVGAWSGWPRRLARYASREIGGQ